MTRLMKKLSRKIGLMPGTVVFVGEKKVEKTGIHIMDFDEKNLEERDVDQVEASFPFKEKSTVTWIAVCGVHDVEAVEKLGTRFGLHPLVMEDIVNTGQRPKIEDSGETVFLVMKMLYQDPEDGKLVSEQVSIVFGRNFVLSFQEKPGDVFEPVRERIRKTVPRVRFMGADYLAYTLADAIVDHYFVVLEQFGTGIEDIEAELFDEARPGHREKIHELKRELTFMRKPVWPLREVISGFDRVESALVHDYTRAYIRDLYEHTVQVIDTLETFRDMVSGLHDLYLSSVSNRMNEVMKVLTIIATIFIPLSFLAGVYGMNFDTSVSRYNLPELGFRYGYPMFWLVALFVGGGLIWFFRRKDWL